VNPTERPSSFQSEHNNPSHHLLTPIYLPSSNLFKFFTSLRAVNAITKASIASRIVAGSPKIAFSSIQRVFLSNGASLKQQQAFPGEPFGSEIINSRTAGVSNEFSQVSPPSRSSA
jgi:hypothetical protein